LRWQHLSIPDAKTDFIDGLFPVCGNGNADSLRGSAVHIYRANISMKDRIFADTDAELLFVPELGAFKIFTELGEIEIKPGEICLVPAGMKFKVELIDKEIRGYLLENFGSHFRLPELGPIGSNGLAYPEHFLCPEAKYENYNDRVEFIVKFQDKLWTTELDHSPLDVVAWKGNYVPFKYDLAAYQVLNTVSFDHVDPSIFTVLTSPAEIDGLANVDFVIFPPRWAVAEHTFRPPYFHRNCMNELMGLIFGQYESRSEGFVPGGLTLHNRFAPHGADLDTYERAIKQDLKPARLDQTLAFMFESSLVYQPTLQALNSDKLDAKYNLVWQGYTGNFKK
jgi:homogentisate 1,2-dioxygenase